MLYTEHLNVFKGIVTSASSKMDQVAYRAHKQYINCSLRHCVNVQFSMKSYLDVYSLNEFLYINGIHNKQRICTYYTQSNESPYQYLIRKLTVGGDN